MAEEIFLPDISAAEEQQKKVFRHQYTCLKFDSSPMSILVKNLMIVSSLLSPKNFERLSGLKCF